MFTVGSVGWHYRPIYRHQVDMSPSIGRLSIECRPILGRHIDRMSVDNSEHDPLLSEVRQARVKIIQVINLCAIDICVQYLYCWNSLL